MGGRGSFVNVNNNDFSFTENGQTYFTIGEVGDVQVLVRQRPFSVKAPEFSHSESRIYAIVQKNEIKCIAYYGEDHKQKRLVEFNHEHGKNRVKPHVHFNMIHDNNEPGTPADEKDLEYFNKITKWLSKI